MCCQVRGALDCRWCDRSHSRMHSIVYSAFDPRAVSSPCTFDHGRCVRPYCVRSHKMQSIANNYLKIPTAQELKRWNIGPAWVTWEMRVHVAALNRATCTRAHCARSHCQGIRLQLFLISPLLATNCTKDLQHTKTLKKHKILGINITKSLTNIS